jgi:hypothetical protein
METTIKSRKDRVREHTSDRSNAQIDQKTKNNIEYYSQQNTEAIQSRIRELDNEWDIERVLETNAALIALTGTILGITVNKKWLALPVIVTTFLTQHAVQGWCPPLPLFRKMGIRTQKEIEDERNALLKLLNS